VLQHFGDTADSGRDKFDEINLRQRAARSFFSRVLSTSSSFRRLASLAFMPPYWASQRRQVGSAIWRCRHTSSSSAPPTGWEHLRSKLNGQLAQAKAEGSQVMLLIDQVQDPDSRPPSLYWSAPVTVKAVVDRLLRGPPDVVGCVWFRSRDGAFVNLTAL
jgi:hypothetical protein